MNEHQVGKASHIASLIIRRMQENLSEEESMELEAWLQEDGENYLLYEDLMDQEKLNQALDQLHSIDHEAAFDRLANKLSLNATDASPQTPEEAPAGPVKRMPPRIWWYMVAAAVILIAGGLYFFYPGKSNTTATPTPPLLVTAQPKQSGALPDSQKALLILADNSVITLNTTNDGTIAKQGNSTIQKTGKGQLNYQFNGAAEIDLGYNTIQTPRGGEYQVVLDDGTRIWLNAGSSLRFPVHFNGPDRKVLLTGEAYFDVATVLASNNGQKKNFIVQVNGIDVQALGTEFNISGYKEDKETKTTVIEGLVKVSTGTKEQLLPPGKKLVASDTSFTVEEADLRSETAWMNKTFSFKNTPLESIMNEIARWYDVDVEYQDNMPPLHFSGEVPRHVTVDEVLQKLELTGGVKFTRKNRLVKVYNASTL